MIKIEKIKMIVSDLDGTIISDGEIPIYTHHVIEKIRLNKIMFSVATGRQYRDFIYMFTFEKPISISLNGALIYDEKGKRLYSNTIDDESIDDLIKLSYENDIIAGFYIEEGIVSLNDADIPFSDWIKKEYIRTGKNTYNFDKEIFYMTTSKEYRNKILKVEMVFMDSGKISEFVDKLAHHVNIEICVTSEFSLEVTKKGVNKANAIKFLLEYYEITGEEIIVCGDSGNDICMLSLFENSIVPSNGSNESKQVAKVITDSVSNQGIAKFLDSLLINYLKD